MLSSLEHPYKVMVYSNNLRNKKRTKRKIKARRNGKLLKFQVTKMVGNCCWSMRDKFTGGQTFVVPSVGTYFPGWPIRAVQLVENCNSK